MFPHERSLVKRMEGKPFALLGINSDTKPNLRKAMARENITWRSWWDGGTTQGPIAKAWNIRGWPTVYVLDARGVIRSKGHSDQELDKLVDSLVADIAAAK